MQALSTHSVNGRFFILSDLNGHWHTKGATTACTRRGRGLTSRPLAPLTFLLLINKINELLLILANHLGMCMRNGV